MMTYQQIYDKLKEPTGEQFTLYNLITIFRDESSWVGSGKQMMELKSLIAEVTGIRPGNCSGCQINVLQDMARFIYNYEKEHPEVLLPAEAEIWNPLKPKRKRIGE